MFSRRRRRSLRLLAGWLCIEEPGKKTPGCDDAAEAKPSPTILHAFHGRFELSEKGWEVSFPSFQRFAKKEQYSQRKPAASSTQGHRYSIRPRSRPCAAMQPG